MAGGGRTVARLIERLTTPKPMSGPVVSRVAYVSPMPPARSGIASYSATVLEGLDRIGYRRRRDLDVIWPVRPKHDVAMARYQLGVYHIGNNFEFHGDIYRLASLHPGIVVLHDLGLDDLTRALVASGDALGYRAGREALLRSEHLSLPEAKTNEPLAWPWCAHLARAARGIIVHSEFCRRYLEDFGCRTPVFVVPHPVVETDADVRRAERTGAAIRSRLGVREGEVLLVAPGDLNPAKQLESIVEAVARLEPNVRLALVGRRVPTWDPDPVLRTSGLGDRVTLAADVSDEEFLGWLHAADVVVDLRFPHRGEVSGTLIRAMQVGRPSVVSGVGTYLDLPDDVVVHVAPGQPDVAELAAVLSRLAGDPESRSRLGERAKAHLEATAGNDRTARGYERAIEQTLSLVLDPRRLALARWARALNEIGVTSDGLDEEFGLGYVRGLADLAPSPGAAGTGQPGREAPVD
jgi:glycosyltransferase involved in cell wall biosynthesis